MGKGYDGAGFFWFFFLFFFYLRIIIMNMHASCMEVIGLEKF